MLKEYEIGPIRPPSEADSLLLRITRNCSWNKCKFCDIYKGNSFRTRPAEEIKADIDAVAAYRQDILDWIPKDQPFDYAAIERKLYSMPEEIAQRYVYVLNWLFNGRGQNVFLQDANTMVLAPDKLVDILTYLREKLPEVQRVTSYGRADTLARLSVPQLTQIREAGLDRIHSGYETGSDKVLTLINKGYTKAQEIEAGQKVREAGIELSVYVMPGVGGKELSDDNAMETADVISRVNPDFVRVRTYVSKYGTGLMEDIQQGRMTECTDREKLLEFKKMIENIQGAEGFLFSDHIINLLEDVNGNLTRDKEKMLATIEAFLALPEKEQKEYQLARRMGMVRSVNHMGMLTPDQMNKVREKLFQLGDDEQFEAYLLRYLRHYI